MISTNFDFTEFIVSVINKDKHVILSLAELEVREAEKLTEIKGYGQEYVDALRRFIYFFTYQQKPFDLEQRYFKMFKAVCKKLISKNQLPSDIMNLFD